MRPPKVKTLRSMISNSEGKVVLNFEMVNSFACYKKPLLYCATKSASGAPKT
jgi:hypothetical protein